MPLKPDAISERIHSEVPREYFERFQKKTSMEMNESNPAENIGSSPEA